jgi:hypothetical protein
VLLPPPDGGSTVGFFAALRAGAHGYVLDSVPDVVLADAVRTLASGEAYVGQPFLTRLLEEFRAVPRLQTGELTRRQAEVLLLGQGLTTKQAALRLGIAPTTVAGTSPRVCASSAAPTATPRSRSWVVRDVNANEPFGPLSASAEPATLCPRHVSTCTRAGRTEPGALPGRCRVTRGLIREHRRRRDAADRARVARARAARADTHVTTGWPRGAGGLHSSPARPPHPRGGASTRHAVALAAASATWSCSTAATGARSARCGRHPGS